MKWTYNYTKLFFILGTIISYSSSGQDTTPPVFTTLPQNQSFLCNAPVINNALNSWYNNNANAIATDDSGTAIISATLTLPQVVSIFNSSSDSLCGDTKLVRVGFIATDPSGNVAGPVFATFSTFDNVAPIVTNAPEDVILECTSEVRDSLINWIKVAGNPQTSDNCNSPVIWESFISNFPPAGTHSIADGPYPALPLGRCNLNINVTFLGRDECGNQVATSGNFEITDTEAPVLDSLPQDITISCDQLLPPPIIVATDNCHGQVSVTVSENNNRINDSTLCEYYNYEVFRRFEATDPCGNTTTHFQTISVMDQTGPTISLTSPITVSCNDILANNQLSLVDTVFDDCTTQLQLTFTESGNIQPCQFTLLRIYQATDICGNETQEPQTIFVRDVDPPTILTPAHDSIFFCTESVDLQAAFDQWIANNAGTTATDECAQVRTFAVVPGSYDLANPSTLPGTPVGQFDATSCPSERQGFLRYEEVDFLHIDLCQNVSISKAIFGVADTTMPQLANCPPNRTISLDDNNCNTLAKEIFPNVLDDCSASTNPAVRSQVKGITSAVPGSTNVLVDTIKFRIGPFNTANTIPVGNPTITINFTNVESDDPLEFFNIINEDGAIIGRTPNTVLQCGTGVVELTNQSLADLQRWLDDGFIDITLAPNDPGASPIFGINDICTGDRIEAIVSFPINAQNIIRPSVRVNNGSPINAFVLDTVQLPLLAGTNTIQYIASDCAGNTSQCSQTIRVIDRFLPEITCPPSVEVTLSADSCGSEVTFAHGLGISDNCFLEEVYAQSLPGDPANSLLTFTFDTLFNEYYLEDKIFTFQGVSPIIYGDGAILEIEAYGDFNEPGEVISIQGDNGLQLGIVPFVNNTECVTTIIDLDISKNLFNTWASDGTIRITASFSPASTPNAINPCDTIRTDNTDGSSYLIARLKYYDANVKLKYNQDSLLIPPADDSITLNLNSGSNLLIYQVSDLGGNSATCQQVVTLRDTIMPTAVCKDITVEVLPDGLTPISVAAEDIDGGSSDNCTDISFTIDVPNITCSMVDSVVRARLTVRDSDFNRDTCTANITVVGPTITPTFSAGLCEGDSLKLFANIDPMNRLDSISIEWFYNGTSFSTEPNPILPNASAALNGTYSLELTSTNGCQSQGEVEVVINPLSKPTLTLSSDTVCLGDEVLLSTDNFFGSVTYAWYIGNPASGVLFDETNDNAIVLQIDSSQSDYYVVVSNEDCTTDPSDVIHIVGIPKPSLTLDSNEISVCENSTFTLSATSTDTSLNYLWKGPDNTIYSTNPTPVINANATRAGIYTVQGNIGGCTTDILSIDVSIIAKPPTPIISGELIYCEGSDFTLTTNSIPNASFYLWFKNGLLQDSTTDNNLVISNATSALSGDWSVAVVEGQCLSSSSTAISVIIDNLINVGADNSGPVCSGDSVTLMATFLPNATYQWSGPNGFTGVGQEIKAPSASGDYSVTITTSTNCSNVATTEVSVIDPPLITALSAIVPPCVDMVSQVTFSPTIIPSGNYEYLWAGPNGFNSTQLNPTLSDLNLQDTGTYSLVVLLNGCPSNPRQVRVNFDLKPPTPAISGPAQLCAGQPLSVSSTTNGATNYCFLTPRGLIDQSSPNLNISQASLADRGLYRVITKKGQCASDTSTAINIVVNEIPPAPSIIGILQLCTGDTLRLSASVNGADSYNWILPDGSVNTTPDIQIAQVDTSNSGSYNLTYTLNGCTSDAANPVVVQVELAVSNTDFITEDLSLCSDLSKPLDICLEPTSLQANTSYALINLNTNTTIANTDTNCFNLIDNRVFIDGENKLIVIGSRNGCEALSIDTLSVLFRMPPNLQAGITNTDLSACSPDEILTLTSLHSLTQTDIQWTPLSSGLVIISPTNQSSLQVSNFNPGENYIVLNYSKDGCIDYSTDTIVLTLLDAPIAIDDSYNVSFNQSIEISPLSNDNYYGDVMIFVNDIGLQGSVNTINNEIQFTPTIGFVGSQQITYDLCLTTCPDLCSTATITFDIGDNVDCQLPSIITPNEDGINDRLVIPCLNTNRFSNSRLVVFNEWGDQVYQSKPYQNDWDGTYGGNPLPVGTYFVVFDPGNNSPALRGFLIIQR